MFKLYRLKNYNFRLIIWLLMISGIGVLLVGSAKASLQSRQLIGVILGLVVMVVVSLMDYSWLLNFYWIIYGVNIIMLLIVRFFGDSAGGATRWLDLGFVRFQPTELSKILLIMFFARFLMDHEDTLNTCKTILASVVLLAVPLVLIKIQPDLKNTITVTIIFCLMMYVAGLSYKIIAGILGVAIPLVIVAFILITQTDIKIIDSYQKDRIMSWMYPEDETYKDDVIQQQNSITAIGSMVMQSANNALGTIYVSGFTAGMRIKSLMMCPFDALGAAVSTFLSQNYGACKLERIRDGYHKGVMVSILYGAFACVVMVFFGRILSMMFVSANESQVLNASALYLRRMGYFYPVLGILITTRMSVQGLGYSARAMLAGFVEMIARCIVALCFVPIFKYNAITWADQAAWVAATLVLIPLWVSAMRAVQKKMS